MTKENHGGPAFPHPNPEFSQNYGVGRPFGGMTLRDYFAGQALVGMAADPNVVGSWDEIADKAYWAAEAMLKRRES